MLKSLCIFGVLSIAMAVCVSCRKQNNNNASTSPNRPTTVTNPPNPVNDDVQVTGTWVLYQYQLSGNATIIPKADTLIFLSINDYTYNHQASKYYMADISTSYRLTLKNSAFGDITGFVPLNFQSSGQINGVEFSIPSFQTPSPKYQLWLRKL